MNRRTKFKARARKAVRSRAANAAHRTMTAKKAWATRNYNAALNRIFGE